MSLHRASGGRTGLWERAASFVASFWGAGGMQVQNPWRRHGLCTRQPSREGPGPGTCVRLRRADVSGTSRPLHCQRPSSGTHSCVLPVFPQPQVNLHMKEAWREPWSQPSGWVHSSGGHRPGFLVFGGGDLYDSDTLPAPLQAPLTSPTDSTTQTLTHDGDSHRSSPSQCTKKFGNLFVYSFLKILGANMGHKLTAHFVKCPSSVLHLLHVHFHGLLIARRATVFTFPGQTLPLKLRWGKCHGTVPSVQRRLPKDRGTNPQLQREGLLLLGMAVE